MWNSNNIKWNDNSFNWDSLTDSSYNSVNYTPAIVPPGIKPVMSMRRADVKPSIVHARDFNHINTIPVLGQGMLIGILGLTYDKEYIIR